MNSFGGDKISKLQALDAIVQQLSEGAFTKQYYKWLHCEYPEYTFAEREQIAVLVVCEWVLVAWDKSSRGSIRAKTAAATQWTEEKIGLENCQMAQKCP